MKPLFLDCPPRYTRTPRDSRGPVTCAAALERPRKRPFDWQDLVVMAACLVAVVALVVLGYGA